jgi:hypothetical protein
MGYSFPQAYTLNRGLKSLYFFSTFPKDSLSRSQCLAIFNRQQLKDRGLPYKEICGGAEDFLAARANESQARVWLNTDRMHTSAVF